jgi:hypothetical protein
MKHDAMLVIRKDLVDRIDAIAAQGSHLRLPQLCEQIDAVRHIARVHGLEPLERLAAMLESAVAFRGHAPILFSYLDLMRDAAGCEEAGPAASDAYMAALSVRMGA